MDICPYWSLLVYKPVPNGITVMSRLRCKSWQCEFCARKNREMWRSHLKKRIGRIGGAWWFITLTAHEDLRGRSVSLQNIRGNLDRLFKRIRRVWGSVDYVRVFETHKTGAFHAHIVLSGLSDRVQRYVAKNGQEYYRPTDILRGHGNWGCQTWFRRNARQIGMGYMVDTKRIQTVSQVVNYITKYMTKEAQAFYEPHLRRIQTGGQIGAANPRGDGGWTVAKCVWGGDVQYGKLRDANLKIVIEPDYWRENVVYPPGK